MDFLEYHNYIQHINRRARRFHESRTKELLNLEPKEFMLHFRFSQERVVEIAGVLDEKLRFV